MSQRSKETKVSAIGVNDHTPGEAGRVMSARGRRLISWGVAIGAVLQVGLLWLTAFPLGVPDEWTWARTEFTILDFGSLWPAVLSGGLLLALVQWLAIRMESFCARGRVLALLVLWLVGSAWLFSAVSAAPGIAGLSRAPFVLYYTRSSGYFTQAREVSEDVPGFLKTYRERIADSTQSENYLHLGTHPPGLTLSIIGIIETLERVPGVRKLLLASQPQSVRESNAIISQMLDAKGRENWEVDSAALWGMSLIVGLLGAGTCVPLYWLCRRLVSAESALWAAGFWLLVPAVAVFFPKSDVMFPCIAMWVQWLWLQGVDRRSAWYGAAAGAGIFIAVCLTLAFVPLGLILVLQGFVVSSHRPGDADAKKIAGMAIPRWTVYWSSALMFFGLILFSWLIGGINLVEVWMQNLRNHASFYDHATRSFIPWLMVNPVELGMAVGLPLALLGLLGLWTICSLRRLPSETFSQRIRRDSEILIPVAVWGILWMSGKNMGEAARLWGFLMPYVVWMAAFSLDRFRNSEGRTRWQSGLFLLQLIVCILTVIRIDGFHFAELMHRS